MKYRLIKKCKSGNNFNSLNKESIPSDKTRVVNVYENTGVQSSKPKLKLKQESDQEKKEPYRFHGLPSPEPNQIAKDLTDYLYKYIGLPLQTKASRVVEFANSNYVLPQYGMYPLTTNGKPVTTKFTNALVASLLSTFSYPTRYVPYVGVFVSKLMQAPDAIFDAAQLANDPNLVNTIHLAIDGSGCVQRIVPGIPTVGTEIVKTVDDAAQTANVDIVEQLIDK